MFSHDSYLVLVHMNPALASHRSVGKIAKCVSAVLEKCQQRLCPVTVAVATPLGNPTALVYLYAVLNDRTAGAGNSFHSSGASVSSTGSEGEYTVKARTRPCYFDGSRRTSHSGEAVVSERALRHALRDLLAPEAPALATLQSASTSPSSSAVSPWQDARSKFDQHLRALRAELKVSETNAVKHSVRVSLMSCRTNMHCYSQLSTDQP